MSSVLKDFSSYRCTRLNPTARIRRQTARIKKSRKRLMLCVTALGGTPLEDFGEVFSIRADSRYAPRASFRVRAQRGSPFYPVVLKVNRGQAYSHFLVALSKSRPAFAHPDCSVAVSLTADSC